MNVFTNGIFQRIYINMKDIILTGVNPLTVREGNSEILIPCYVKWMSYVVFIKYISVHVLIVFEYEVFI